MPGMPCLLGTKGAKGFRVFKDFKVIRDVKFLGKYGLRKATPKALGVLAAAGCSFV